MEPNSVEIIMSGVELVGLIASIASLILAVGAIWLSVVFFKMSNEASKATTEAAKGVDASVQRLENLFDKLYSDTFSMMKDTVSDMRKHIWNGDDNLRDSDGNIKSDILEEADRKADEKVAEIKSAMDKQLSEILAKQKADDGKFSDIGVEIERLLDNVIQTSRLVESEAREETVRNHIVMTLKRFSRNKKVIMAAELVEMIGEKIPPHRVIRELDNMRDEGIIYFEGYEIAPDTKIKLLNIREKNEAIRTS
jgi:hypothetical protein